MKEALRAHSLVAVVGPPGSGKTAALRVAARELNVDMLPLDLWTSRPVDEVVSMVKSLFVCAANWNRKPTLLVLDSCSSTGRAKGTSSCILPKLLAWMKTKKTIALFRNRRACVAFVCYKSVPTSVQYVMRAHKSNATVWFDRPTVSDLVSMARHLLAVARTPIGWFSAPELERLASASQGDARQMLMALHDNHVQRLSQRVPLIVPVRDARADAWEWTKRLLTGNVEDRDRLHSRVALDSGPAIVALTRGLYVQSFTDDNVATMEGAAQTADALAFYDLCAAQEHRQRGNTVMTAQQDRQLGSTLVM